MLRAALRQFCTCARLAFNEVALIIPPNTNHFFSFIFIAFLFVKSLICCGGLPEIEEFHSRNSVVGLQAFSMCHRIYVLTWLWLFTLNSRNYES